MDKIDHEKFLDRVITKPDVDMDIIDNRREEILDLLTEMFRMPSLNSDKNMDYIDKDYINIMDIDLCDFKDCFLSDYDNVVSFEKYIAYRWNKTGM